MFSARSVISCLSVAAATLIVARSDRAFVYHAYAADRGTTAACDATLWQHVYKPSRLKILDQCKTVTGLIREVRPDEDGDLHALLVLDPGQSSLVNKRNAKKKGGALVIEIVCAVQPKSPKSALKACEGYRASIAMPAEGTHARVSGTYVIDTHNGWAEIHPVSRIDQIQ